jgi:hypothetical protein
MKLDSRALDLQLTPGNRQLRRCGANPATCGGIHEFEPELPLVSSVSIRKSYKPYFLQIYTYSEQFRSR